MKIPKIRFNGYTHAWEQCRLSDICNYTSSPLIVSDAKETGKYELYDANGIIGMVDKFYMDADYITIIKDGSAGRVRKLPKNTSFTSTMGAITNKNSDLNFLFCILEEFDFKKLTTGSVIQHIYFSDYGKEKINVPNYEEQEKIGNFFKQLDNLVVLQQCKCEQLKKVKKFMLQNLFPKNNENIPKIRFNGYTHAWEQCKIGEITKSISFKNYISDYGEIGAYEVIQQGDNPIAGYSDGEPFYNFNDVTLFGDHTLSLYKPNKPFFLASDGIKILEPKNRINNLFYFYLLEKYKPNSEGYKRHFSILKECFSYFCTKNDEQQKIGDFFKQLDNLVVLQQLKCEQLKKVKKFMLKNMFC